MILAYQGIKKYKQRRAEKKEEKEHQAVQRASLQNQPQRQQGVSEIQTLVSLHSYLTETGGVAAYMLA